MGSPAIEKGRDKEEGIKEIIFDTFMHTSNPVVSVIISRYSFTKAFVIAFVMTFFSMFDVPVFWPILLCYWIVLFVLTMRRQIAHMIKYKYIPFSLGKQVSFRVLYTSIFLFHLTTFYSHLQ
jgi:hypothetical protein